MADNEIAIRGGDGAPAEGFAAENGARGTNQTGVRLHNERLILSLIRRHGTLTKADIARATGLTPQATTVIINRLEADGLLTPQARQRGRIGQPAVPWALDPQGAFSLGMVIGRRSCDLVLIDFGANVRNRLRRTHALPQPDDLLAFARTGLAELAGGLGGGLRRRIAGIGLAMPFELWSWEADLGAPPGALAAWRAFDMRGALESALPWPVELCNDATAACAAELIFGQAGRFRDFLYVFVGTFVGGGLVIDGAVVPGRTGNSGAIGSMPIAPDGRPTQQLIRTASIHVLEASLVAAGRDASAIWLAPHDWSAFGSVLEDWIEPAAQALALAALATSAVIEIEAVVVDGVFPAEVRRRLVEATARRVEGLDRRGLTPFETVEGSLGRDARAIGAAALPLWASERSRRAVVF